MGKRQSGIPIGDRYREIVDLALNLKMKPRQLQEAFRIVGHFADSNLDGGVGRVGWCVGAALILLAFLRVARHDIYESLRSGKMTDEEIGRMFTAFGDKEKAQWWFSIYLSGRGQFSSSPVDPEILMEICGIWEEGTALKYGAPGSRLDLSQFRRGWDSFGCGVTTGFEQVINRIESVVSFGQD